MRCHRRCHELRGLLGDLDPLLCTPFRPCEAEAATLIEATRLLLRADKTNTRWLPELLAFLIRHACREVVTTHTLFARVDERTHGSCVLVRAVDAVRARLRGVELLCVKVHHLPVNYGGKRPVEARVRPVNARHFVFVSLVGGLIYRAAARFNFFSIIKDQKKGSFIFVFVFYYGRRATKI
jgi:hypothetical protein